MNVGSRPAPCFDIEKIREVGVDFNLYGAATGLGGEISLNNFLLHTPV